MSSPVITHVIFDMDGVLLNTEMLYTQAMSKYCDSFGKTFTWEIKIKQMGRKPEESARILLDALSIPDTVENYKKSTNDMLYQLFPECDQMKGAERLVEHLAAKGIPLAVATGSSDKDFEMKTMKHGSLFKHFSHVVKSGSDSDVKKGKPSPDIFLVAARRFAEAPLDMSHCLVFEDAPNGVQAALDAGMHVVWMPDPNIDKTQFQSCEKIEVIDTLNDFVPEKYGLPGF